MRKENKATGLELGEHNRHKKKYEKEFHTCTARLNNFSYERISPPVWSLNNTGSCLETAQRNCSRKKDHTEYYKHLSPELLQFSIMMRVNSQSLCPVLTSE